MTLRVRERCPLQRGVAELVVQAVVIGWTGAVKLLRAPVIENHRGELENLRQLSDQLFWKWLLLLNQEDRAAECIQALEVKLACRRIQRPALGDRGKAAAHKCCG